MRHSLHITSTRAIRLAVAPMPCVVPDGVFDAWSWCESDLLEWRRPSGGETSLLARANGPGGGVDGRAAIDGQNPPGLVFVMREDTTFLPRELARLHAFGYGLAEELALAPWAIDDATDLLYEKRRAPGSVFWLAANTVEALVWGLHDWAHFHNHGPFEQIAMTELQCDLVALAWLRANAEIIFGRGDHVSHMLAKVARDLARLSRRRFADEHTRAPVDDLDALFSGPYPTTPLSASRPLADA